MKGIKKKFEEAAQRIHKKPYKEIGDHHKQAIRYMVCTETAIAEEAEKRKQKKHERSR